MMNLAAAAKLGLAVAALGGHHYTVQPGDTLSHVAAAQCGNSADWPSIAEANKTITNPDLIYPGQSLTVACSGGTVASAVALQVHTADVVGRHAGTDGDGDHDGDMSDAPAIGRHAAPRSDGDGDHDGDMSDGPRFTPAAAAAPASSFASATSASGAFPGAACIVARESGGNPNAVNPSSGAGGLFQDLPSTWASLGGTGLPENAPVSVQIALNQKLFAQAGLTPWAADGCPGT